MTAPEIYIVADNIATAFWMADGIAYSCGIKLFDGSPDWENASEVNLSMSAEVNMEATFAILAHHIAHHIAHQLANA